MKWKLKLFEQALSVKKGYIPKHKVSAIVKKLADESTLDKLQTYISLLEK